MTWHNPGYAAIEASLEHYGYAAIFLAILVEGIGVPAPGQSLLVASAILAAHGDLNIGWVLGWAFLGALLGPCLGFGLGRLGGRPLLAKMRVNPARLDRLIKVFDRYGVSIILLARFVDGLRQLHGLAAGLADMPLRKFFILAVPGASLWTGFWGAGAFFLDQRAMAWHLSWLAWRPWLILLTLLGGVAMGLWVMRRGKDKQ